MPQKIFNIGWISSGIWVHDRQTSMCSNAMQDSGSLRNQFSNKVFQTFFWLKTAIWFLGVQHWEMFTHPRVKWLWTVGNTFCWENSDAREKRVKLNYLLSLWNTGVLATGMLWAYSDCYSSSQLLVQLLTSIAYKFLLYGKRGLHSHSVYPTRTATAL